MCLALKKALFTIKQLVGQTKIHHPFHNLFQNMQITIKRLLALVLSVCLPVTALTVPSTVQAISFNGIFPSFNNSGFPADKQFSGAVPVLQASLRDAFADPDGDGKAERGTEITYTATIVNNGLTAAENVNLSVPLDSNLTPVENSLIISRRTLPAIAATNPADGATNVSIGAALTVTFNQPVYAAADSFDLECPANVAKSFTVSGSGTNAITLTPQVSLPTGTTCRVRVNASKIASVGANDPLPADYIFSFSTISGAMLRLSEVAPNISSNRDLVELTVEQSGSTNGMKLVQNGIVLATLPDVWVSAGEIIVVHFSPNLSSGDAPASETTGKNQYPSGTYTANYDSAWDFHAGTTGISFSNIVLRVNDASGSTQDAAAFVRPGTTPTAFPQHLQAIQAEGLWFPSDCGGTLCTYNSYPSAFDVSVNWSSASVSTHSAQRLYNSGVYSYANWAVEPSTFGAANSPANYRADQTKTANKKFAQNEKSTNAVGNDPLTINLGSILPQEIVIVTFRAVVNTNLPSGTTRLSSQGNITGSNFAALATDDPAAPGADDPTVTPVSSLAPTAAAVRLSGRIMDSNLRGVSKARVQITDSGGNIRTAMTNPFGFYHFYNIAAGQTIVISVASKRFQFAPKTINVLEETNNLNFTAEP
jgi:uncharacterized repeat protein (TIGR01451 family)